MFSHCNGLKSHAMDPKLCGQRKASTHATVDWGRLGVQSAFVPFPINGKYAYLSKREKTDPRIPDLLHRVVRSKRV